MSGDPLLGLECDVQERLEVVQTERGPIAPGAGVMCGFSTNLAQGFGMNPFDETRSIFACYASCDRSGSAGMVRGRI